MRSSPLIGKYLKNVLGIVFKVFVLARNFATAEVGQVVVQFKQSPIAGESLTEPVRQQTIRPF